MSIAKKAVVLAAGLGTRLRPLTCVTPKPLMPVWGEPLLGRIVAKLREVGVEQIVVNCHYLHEQVEAWCAANGCRVSYEPEILGTGGVLNPLREWIGRDDFYLVNGDIVVENLPDLNKVKLPSSAIGVALTTESGPRTIEVEPTANFITCWKSPDPGWEGTYTYCGFSLLKAEILKYVEPTGFSTIVQAYERAMADGRFMVAETSDDLMWSDAGTVASFVELNRDGEENAFADFPQLKAVLGEKAAQTKIGFLGARGSDRAFFKLGDDRLAVIYDDAKRGENAKYAPHARWLTAHGAATARLLEDHPESKTSVFAWAGEEKRLTLADYVKVVRELVRFHNLAQDPDFSQLDLEPAFDADLYKWERELFAEYCLGRRYRRECPAAAMAELEQVAGKLLAEPQVLVHRDFQSTNILWPKGGMVSVPTFIDFQGMRLGAAAYDLASLVYDPYVGLDDKTRTAAIRLYAELAGRPDIVKITPFAAVERLAQCLGAYGRLASVGQPQFARFFVPALRNLLAAADEAGLDAIGALAEDLLAVEEHAAHHQHRHPGEE